jgi:magnesium-transporting ATPase (P-type)
MKIGLVFFFINYTVSFFYLESSAFVSVSINRLYVSIFVFIFSVIWFKDIFEELNKSLLFEETDFQYLLSSENFYFVAGVFIYYATTFFLFLSSSLIFESNLYFNDFWVVNIIATLVLRIFLIISVWKMKKA